MNVTVCHGCCASTWHVFSALRAAVPFSTYVVGFNVAFVHGKACFLSFAVAAVPFSSCFVNIIALVLRMTRSLLSFEVAVVPLMLMFSYSFKKHVRKDAIMILKYGSARFMVVRG